MRFMMIPSSLLLLLALALLPRNAAADQAAKDASFTTAPITAEGSAAVIDAVGGAGYRTEIGDGEDRIPVVVVSGTPFEMGYHLGRLMKEETSVMVDRFLAGLGADEEALEAAWFDSTPYTDDRYEAELLGVAAGSGIEHKKLRHAHVAPMLVPYSCSSVAVWGKASKDGKLYQSRALDWHLGLGVQEYPAVVIYLPDAGLPHCNLCFGGMVGCHTGMNAAGLVLTSMGNSPPEERPYALRGAYFLSFFRTMLYDAPGVAEALAILEGLPRVKRYHYVFGDGIGERGGLKIKAHAPETPPNDLIVWRDNDPTDEFAPAVLEDVVYNDEGRGAFPMIKKDYGALDAERVLEIAKAIVIKGSNVMDVVYNASDLECWVAYAQGRQDAAERPFVHFALKQFDGDGDGSPDIAEGGGDADGDGVPDFVDGDTH